MVQIKENFRDNKGQSLVSAAIIFPLLVLIFAGLVELTHLAVTQNRVSMAARNGARYAADGGEDTGISITVLNTITETLSMSTDVWDIWSIRASVTPTGTIPSDSFIFEHIYGDGLTEGFATTDTAGFEDGLRQRIEAELTLDGTGTVVGDLGADLNLVGVYALHDIDSILGLDVLLNLAGIETMTGFSVMRRSSLSASVFTTAGCNGVFPIAVEQQAVTVTETDYNSLAFTYPVAKPAWASFPIQPTSPEPLTAAEEGNVFVLELGTAAGDFNWLKWNTTIDGINPPPAGHSILGASLFYPGNNADHTDRGDSPGGGTFRGYENVIDASDQELHRGDWIARDTVSGGLGGAGVELRLQDHIDTGRTIRIVLWDDSAGGYAANSFQASGFGIFRLRAYGADWLLMELFRHDNSCGQN